MVFKNDRASKLFKTAIWHDTVLIDDWLSKEKIKIFNSLKIQGIEKEIAQIINLRSIGWVLGIDWLKIVGILMIKFF